MQNPSLSDSSVTTSCANILETLSMRQAKTLDKFAVVIFNNQSDDINKISTEVGKRFQNLSKIMTGIKNRSTGETTISVNNQ